MQHVKFDWFEQEKLSKGGSANEHHGVLSGSHGKLKELFHSLSSDNDSDAWRGVNLCCSDRTAQQKTLWNQNILLGLEGFCFCRCVISHVGHPYLNRVCHSRPASCSHLLVSPWLCIISQFERGREKKSLHRCCRSVSYLLFGLTVLGLVSEAFWDENSSCFLSLLAH